MKENQLDTYIEKFKYFESNDSFDLNESSSNINKMIIEAYATRISQYASMSKNYLFSNDGPEYGPSFVHQDSKISKTSTAHTVMFDFCSEKVCLFAKGFHSNIFDVPSVLDAFSNYVKRIVEQNIIPEKEALVTLISNESRENTFKKHIKNSKFVQKAKELEKEYERNILNILEAPLSSKVNINIPSINDNQDNPEIIFSDNLTLTEIANLNTFSVFGDFYRIKSNTPGLDHEAYLNFGDKDTAEKLRSMFDLIKEKSKTVSI